MQACMQVDCIPRRLRSGTPPGRIAQASAVYERKLYIFGGTGGALGSGVSNLTYSVDLDDPAAEWKLLETSSPGPAPRSGATAIIKGHHLNVFGGESGSANKCNKRESFGDVWRLNLKTFVWKPPQVGGMSPTPRRHHTAVRLDSSPMSSQSKACLLLFGGEGTDRSFPCSVYLNDVWRLNIEKKIVMWQKLRSVGCPASPRSLHTATKIAPNEMVIFGGISCAIKASSVGPQMTMKSVGAASHAKDDVHLCSWEGKECTWRMPREVEGNAPGGLYGHSAAMVENGNKRNIVYFGGYPDHRRMPNNKMYVLSIPPIAAADCDDTASASAAASSSSISFSPKWTWSMVKMSGYLQSLPPRYMHCCNNTMSTARNNQFVVYGGSLLTKNGFATADIYVCTIKFQKGKEGRRRQLRGLHSAASMTNLRAKIRVDREITSSNVLNDIGPVVGSNDDDDDDDDGSQTKILTSRLQQIMTGHKRSTRDTISALRRSGTSLTSLKMDLKEPDLWRTTQHSHLSKGLDAFSTKHYKRREMLPEKKGKKGKGKGKEKKIIMRASNAAHKKQSTCKVVLMGEKGGGGLVHIGYGSVRHPDILKVGMYGKKPHLNYIRKRRPMSARIKGGKITQQQRQQRQQWQQRQQQRPQSASVPSRSIFRLTDSITESSMKSLPSSSLLLLSNKMSPLKIRLSPKQRPKSAKIRQSKRKEDATRTCNNLNTKRERPKSAAVRRKQYNLK